MADRIVACTRVSVCIACIARRAPLLFTENETNNERLFGTANRNALCQGWDQRFRRVGKTGGGQSEPDGHQGSRTLSATMDAGDKPRHPPAAEQCCGMTTPLQ